MAYNKDIPQATDKLSDSQAQILENYEQLSTYLSFNHLDINGTGNVGKHKFVTLTQQADPGVLATEAAIYTKAGSVNTDPQLFWQQGTSNNVVNFTEFANNATDGWTRLPSGILVKWMKYTVPAGTGPSSFNTAVWPTGAGQPVFSATPFQIQITIQTSNFLSGIITSQVTTGAGFTDNLKVVVQSWINNGAWTDFVLNIIAFGLE